MKWSPGDELWERMISSGHLSIAEAASVIGASRHTIYNIVWENWGLSLNLARKLAKAYGTTVAHWMDIKFEYERRR